MPLFRPPKSRRSPAHLGNRRTIRARLRDAAAKSRRNRARINEYAVATQSFKRSVRPPENLLERGRIAHNREQHVDLRGHLARVRRELRPLADQVLRLPRGTVPNN